MNRRGFFHSALTGLLAVTGLAVFADTAEAQRKALSATVRRRRGGRRRRRRRGFLLWIR
jgi:hypothetical protein